MLAANVKLHEVAHPVLGLAMVVPSSSTPAYVSMKNFARCQIQVWVKNATTVTGSAITVKQATAVAGTGEKAVSFSSAYRNIDLAASDVLAEFSVTSDTFTTDSTNSKNLLYLIDVNTDMLDIANGFDCIRAGTGNATAATVHVIYMLYGARFGALVQPSAIVD